MIIRKLFRVETAHRVRNCTSKRCAYSVHGHSAIIEVLFESKRLDNAGMVLDFGLTKGPIKEFIDSMDHCHILWDKDDTAYLSAARNMSDRWIQVPFNPSAEMLATYIFKVISEIINDTWFVNGEDTNTLQVHAVRYHETATGYAEAHAEDLALLPSDLNVTYSKGVTDEWSQALKDWVTKETHIWNPNPTRQVGTNDKNLE